MSQLVSLLMELQCASDGMKIINWVCQVNACILLSELSLSHQIKKLFLFVLEAIQVMQYFLIIRSMQGEIIRMVLLEMNLKFQQGYYW
jgi:hypothetical protein